MAEPEWEQDGLGQLRVLQRVGEYEFAVELDIMRGGVNKNGWDYRNLEAHYKTFSGTPILIAYIGRQVGDGHNSEEVLDPETGQRYRSYMGATCERIVGMVSENEEDITLLTQGGHTWIRAKGRIWSFYAPEVVEKIVRTGRMEVSAETNVLEEHKEGTIDVFTKWTGLGVTILGDAVAPAIPGASIRALAAMEQEFKQMQLRVASLQKGAGKPQKNNKENKGVRNVMFVNKTLAKELAAKFPDYHVLSFSEDGMHVCLLNKETGETFRYSFLESDKGVVVQERVKPVSLSATLEFEDSKLCVAFDQVLEAYTTRIATLTSELEAARNERDAQKEKAEAAEAREKSRRIKASRQAAEEQLRQINANRAAEDTVESCLIEPVLQMADNGAFVGNCDENGEWRGDEAARSMVRDIAMQRQMQLDEQRAESARNAMKKRYAFENNHSGAEDNSLAGLYSRVVG